MISYMKKSNSEEKDYWHDLGMIIWRELIRKDEIYIPPDLRGVVEYHIKKNGQVVLRKPKKHGKKEKKQ
jgi:hypothetical protein